MRTLTFGERLELRIRYAETDGRPVPGATVTFAMVGVAHDSTLEATSARTDGSGVAVARLRAGTVPATFDLRATADHAEALRVPIAVGEAGFGDLRVSSRYDGMRSLARRVVSVYRSRGCAEASAIAVADREAVLGEVDEVATFDALPAGASYAVVVRGEGHDGAQLARGCQEGVEIVADRMTSVDVALSDVALVGAGSYRAQLTLQIIDVADRVAEVIGALDRARTSEGADARQMLDALIAEIARTDATAAAALESARERESLDVSLARALDAAGSAGALAAARAELRERLASLTLHGTLTLDARGIASPIGGLVFPVVLASGGEPGNELRLALDGFELGPPVIAAIGLAPFRETLVVLSVEIAMPLGAIAVAALDAMARAEPGPGGTGTDEGSVGRWLAQRSRCDAAVAWAAGVPAVRTTCDETCVRRACRSAAEVVATELFGALSGLDASYARVWLSGEAGASDEDGDAVVDAFGPSVLEARWSGLDGAVALPVGAALVCRRESP